MNPLLETSKLLVFIFRELYFLGGLLLSLWWIYVPIILLVISRDLWLKYIREKYIQGMDWVLLEVIPPKEIKKTPRAMEQIFAGLHGIQSTPIWKDRFMSGALQNWFSFEMISQSGEIHFLIRTLRTFRNIVESQVYAQYPEAEISEVQDYINSIPADIPNQEYDLWGTELVLVKDDGYPIRTYPYFEKDVILEEQRLDPTASLLEVMGELNQGEQIWIQTLIRPVGEKWKEEGEALRNKLMGRKVEKKMGDVQKEAVAWGGETKSNIKQLFTGSPTGPSAEEEAAKKVDLTKGEQEVIYAIEQNIAKIGYEVVIRFLYLAPVSVFSRANVAAVIGCYKQFGTQNLNAFMPNKRITTKIDYNYQLKKTREHYRKQRVFFDYKKRYLAPHSKNISYLKPLSFERFPIINWFFMRTKPFTFNIEELATVYHFPGIMVKAPTVPRIEAKKGQPPTRLPIE